MKRVLLTLALLGASTQVRADAFTSVASAQTQASSTCATFFENAQYPLALVVAVGAAYGIYRLYDYMNQPSAAYKAEIKSWYKKRYKNAFFTYIDYTLKTMSLDELKKAKADKVEDALKWLSKIPQGDIVANRKKRAEVFNETSHDDYQEKKEAFNELFDEVVMVFSLRSS